MGKPILSLDFDGVIHSYTSGWQGARNIPDPPVDGAIKFLTEATEHFTVAIFSSRSRYWGGRRAMKRYLFEHAQEHFRQYEGDALDAHVQMGLGKTSAAYLEAEEHLFNLDKDLAKALLAKIKFPLMKPPAKVGLDDRVITFNGKWPTMKRLQNFKPWNKK